MKFIILFNLLAIICGFISVKSELVPIIKTSQGDVLGAVYKSPGRLDFYAFLGIRYAQSPVGRLRWKPPVPAFPWKGIFDGRKVGPWCNQNAAFMGDFMEKHGIVLSEDCLRLNIATRNLNVGDNGKLVPVIVDIHGGGFTGGGTSYDILKPLYLMDRDIVHVSINYRLGVLGFLSAGIPDVAGNVGLKDQVLALKWVKENIKSFGGDPDNITIMGHSAGAYSVTGHMVSPMSAGLFHRAIPVSGSITTHFLLPEHHQLDVFHRVAREFECFKIPKEITIYETVDCLRKIPAQTLADVSMKLLEFGLCPMMALLPVLEKDFGQERFFIEQPTVSLQSGNFHKVPVLTGVTSDEVAVIAHMILNDESLRNKMDENFDEIAPICFLYDKSDDRKKDISKTIRENFIPSKLENTTKSLKELQKPFADSLISHGVHRLVHLLNTQVDVFYYKFSFVGRYSEFKYPSDKPWGVEHGDELQYLFQVPDSPVFQSDDNEFKTMHRFTRYITNFAGTGNPNDPDDEFIGDDVWLPFNKDEQNYMEIGRELEMKSGLFLDRLRVWDELFPLDLITATEKVVEHADHDHTEL